MDKRIYLCFPKGKHKVLTLSYDDGMQEDETLLALFNQYGMKGTFHINSGLLGQNGRLPAEKIGELYKGHEIALHTLTHPTIARCPSEQIIHEVLSDRKGLEKITGYPVRGFSYPNGSYNKKIKELLPHLGVCYARVVGNSDSFDMPEDFYEWKATCHHNHRLLEHAENFIDLSKTQYLYMMYVWGHSYEFAKDNNWSLMERFCELTGGRNDIWYASNIEIVDYLEAWKRLQFAGDLSFVYNPSVLSVWISVDGEIVELPGGKITRM